MENLDMIYKAAFDGAGPFPETRERILAIGAVRQKRPGHYVRRLSGTLAAAIVMLALLGCGTVAVIYGDSIQNWFSYYWEAVTKQPMSESQTALIDHLTQPIGLSQTVGDVTVTVDSATVGDNVFYLLIRAEGLKFDRRQGYMFDGNSMVLDPEPRDLGGYGFQFHGLDGDGAALFLIEANYPILDGGAADTSPLAVKLDLSDLRLESSGNYKVVAKGDWSFSFTLDRSRALEAVDLPDSTVNVYDLDTKEHIPILLTNIRVTNTGIRFRYKRDRTTDISWISVVLDSGAEIDDGGGFGNVLEDGETIEYSHTWSVPVDLDEVACIRIGGTEIPVP